MRWPERRLQARALGRLADHDPSLQATSWAWRSTNSLTSFGYYPFYTRPCISVSLFNTKTQEHKTLFTTGAPLKMPVYSKEQFGPNPTKKAAAGGYTP